MTTPTPDTTKPFNGGMPVARRLSQEEIAERQRELESQQNKKPQATNSNTSAQDDGSEPTPERRRELLAMAGLDDTPTAQASDDESEITPERRAELLEYMDLSEHNPRH